MENQTDDKVKLTVDEQITDMRTKNVQFEICSIEDAKKFLKYNNYYFKLKSYARNYVVNPQTKKYYNLDFAYLVELSKLDMHIRKIILEMSLDVEHYLKVRLMNDLSNNPLEDGYNLSLIHIYSDKFDQKSPTYNKASQANDAADFWG